MATTEKNILVMHFPDSSKAFQALSEMKGQPGVSNAAVLERTAEGQLHVTDSYAPEAGAGVAVGGLVGALIGILAGPVGVLLGWSSGMLVGAAYEIDEDADNDDGFTILSRSIPPGGNALVAEMVETSHAIADETAAKLDGTVVRIPATEMAMEIDSAQEAARSAAAEARKVRRAKRRDEFKEKMSSLGHHGKKSE
jgi:uncharacterized membrane protein